MFLAAPAAQQGSAASTFSPIISMVFVFAIFWVLVLRPQQQKDKAHKLMLGKLRKGDKVVMSGGIHGEITEVKDDLLTVRIAEKVEVKAGRNSISQLRT